MFLINLDIFGFLLFYFVCHREGHMVLCLFVFYKPLNWLNFIEFKLDKHINSSTTDAFFFLASVWLHRMLYMLISDQPDHPPRNRPSACVPWAHWRYLTYDYYSWAAAHTAKKRQNARGGKDLVQSCVRCHRATCTRKYITQHALLTTELAQSVNGDPAGGACEVWCVGAIQDRAWLQCCILRSWLFALGVGWTPFFKVFCPNIGNGWFGDLQYL